MTQKQQHQGPVAHMDGLDANDKIRSAFDEQIGGDHYKDMAIQPTYYCFVNNIGHAAGDAIAYISRYKLKGGISDLEKAIHTLELLIDLENEASADAKN